MLEAEQRLASQGAVVSNVNAEGGRGLEDLFGALLRNLPAQDLRTRLLQHVQGATDITTPVLALAGRWLGSMGPTGSAVSDGDLIQHWPGLSNALFKALKCETRPIVLFIDELPFLIQNTIESDRSGGRLSGVLVARQILVTLRSWRDLPNLAMIVAGSIGMRGLALRHGLDPGAFSDMLPIQLPPLEKEEARSMLTALANGEASCLSEWTKDSTEAVLNCLPDLYPGFIQLAFQCALDRHAFLPERIRNVLRDHFEPQLHHQFFSQFDNRLQREDLSLRRYLAAGIDLVVDSECDGGVVVDAFYEEMMRVGCGTPEEVASILREDGFIYHDVRGGTLRPASAMISAWRNSTPRKRSR